MTCDLTEQISKLHRTDQFDLQALVDCSVAHLSDAGSGPTCQSISYLGEGNFNTVYKLVFSDGTELAASLSRCNEEDFDPQSKLSEIATMEFVRESGLYPDIPVPKVHTWDVTFDNDVCAPYIIMDLVQGVCLQDLKDGKGLYDMDTLPYDQQLSLTKELAKLQAYLSKPVPFQEIGSIMTRKDSAGERHFVIGPLATSNMKSQGGPFKSADELWWSRLDQGISRAVHEWCSLEKDLLPECFPGSGCTPQGFAENVQLLSALIPQFKIPQAYSKLTLLHPDLALRNILFDKESLSSGQPKITGVIDWGGAQVLPLMLTASYPDDLMTKGYEPFTRSDYPDQGWLLVPPDWTSTGDPARWPIAYGGGNVKVDMGPIVSAMVRRFYLRSYFNRCFAEQMHVINSDGDSALEQATLFTASPYYLMFHETLMGGYRLWCKHGNWVRETYWRLRSIAGQGKAEGSLIVGPDVYKDSITPLIRDLRIFEAESPGGEPSDPQKDWAFDFDDNI